MPWRPAQLEDNDAILSAILPFAAVVVSAGLMLPLGARLFGGPRYGFLTATLFLMTPLLWYATTSAPHALRPLPCVVAWLLAATRLEHRSDGWWWPAAAGGALGLGVMTTPAAAVMMPLYLLLTMALAMYGRAVEIRTLAVMLAAFFLTASPAVVTVIRDPDEFRSLVSAYRLYDVQRFNILQGVREMASWTGLTARTEVYYDFFDPAFLFLTGRVLLFPLAVLLPIGVWRLMTKETGLVARLSLVGFFVAPFAASLTAEAPTPGRILFLTPFAALVSIYGVQAAIAWKARRVERRETTPP